MSFVFNEFLLSEIKPVKLTYKFNNEEKLEKYFDQFANGFSYWSHKLLENHKDSLLSKRNALFLTEPKNLADIFSKESTNERLLQLGEIGGSFYLKFPGTDTTVTTSEGLIFRGGTGIKMPIYIIPSKNGGVNLKSSENTWLQVDKQYPYTVRLSNQRLSNDEQYRREFILEYKNHFITIKHLTVEGYRYFAFGSDFVGRMVGLMLNESIANQYVFEIESISNAELMFNYQPTTFEVKYYNDLNQYAERETLKIKQFKEVNINLIASLPTYKITEDNDDPVAINIALAKTYFTPEETYITTALQDYTDSCNKCGCDYSPRKITRMNRLTACGDFLDHQIHEQVTEIVTDVSVTGNTSFIFEYETTTANEIFTLPLITNSSTYYDFFIEWGDGIVEHFVGYNVVASHSYVLPGTHIITIGPPPV